MDPRQVPQLQIPPASSAANPRGLPILKGRRQIPHVSRAPPAMPRVSHVRQMIPPVGLAQPEVPRRRGRSIRTPQNIMDYARLIVDSDYDIDSVAYVFRRHGTSFIDTFKHAKIAFDRTHLLPDVKLIDKLYYQFMAHRLNDLHYTLFKPREDRNPESDHFTTVKILLILCRTSWPLAMDTTGIRMMHVLSKHFRQLPAGLRLQQQYFSDSIRAKDFYSRPVAQRVSHGNVEYPLTTDMFANFAFELCLSAVRNLPEEKQLLFKWMHRKYRNSLKNTKAHNDFFDDLYSDHLKKCLRIRKAVEATTRIILDAVSSAQQ